MRRRRGASYDEATARKAIAASKSYAEALRRMGLRDKGGNGAVLKKWAAVWEIPTDHFDRYAASRGRVGAFGGVSPKPLEEVLVENSTYHRGHLKRRLYDAGLKKPECELCGQGEIWRGRRMALILDHINGIGTDNRLENLRIVCANCNATLDTHCGRNKRRLHHPRPCEQCGNVFDPAGRDAKYCSNTCNGLAERGVPHLESRRVERPPYPQLLAEIEALGWSAVGRKYGVSDNAVRKWLRMYERAQEMDDAA